MTTLTTRLLHAIWNGECTPAVSSDTAIIRDIFAEFFPFRVLFLEVPEGPLCGHVLTDETEVIPALPIGDVIAEEFDLIVPPGTSIVCCSKAQLSDACPTKERSALLGRICAEIVIDTVRNGTYRIEKETEVISHLADVLRTTASNIDAVTGELCLSFFDPALRRRIDDLHGAAVTSASGARLPECRPAQRIQRPLSAVGLLSALTEGCDLEDWMGGVATAMHARNPDSRPFAPDTGLHSDHRTI